MQQTERPDRSRVLLTGASGYVGGKLLPRLQSRGLLVRCLARRPDRLKPLVPHGTEVIAGDVMDRASLDAAMPGIHTAYFLVHSMGEAGRFEDLDRQAAANFADAASAAGVNRIIYLGGLGESDTSLSVHLRSRHEVGEVLRGHAGATEVLEFRASIVIGSGSASFEMIRALVERLPVMVTPRWVSVLAQPIAIDDLLAYLQAGLDLPCTGHQVLEIGGREVMSYRDIMREYARQRGLRRVMISVPVLTPRLSSLWLRLVTPLYAKVGRSLIDSLRHPTVVCDHAALELFDIHPCGVVDAIAQALQHDDHAVSRSSWTSAIPAKGSATRYGGTRFRNRLVDSRSLLVAAPPENVFRAIARLGGRNGWYYGNWLWRLRGWLDQLVGGPGMSRQRGDPERVALGDPVDFWRVEACDPPSRLRLAAEMKLPGRAWLEFDVTAEGTGSLVRQTAAFDSVGLLGLTYWYAMYPFHQFVLAGLLRGIVRASTR